MKEETNKRATRGEERKEERYKRNKRDDRKHNRFLSFDKTQTT
jgi:hypothetical protein